MSDKLRPSFKERLINLVGENWITSYWLANQAETDAGLLQLQNRDLLVKLLDSFPGKQDLSNPDFLRLLNDWSGVELRGQVPEVKGTAFVVGNYIGREPTAANEPPFIDPTIWCLVKLFEVAHNLELDEVLAVARETAFDGMDQRLKEALSTHLAFAKKEVTGQYSLPFREKHKLRKVIRAKRGLLWTAPAATTELNGLKFDRLITTSIKQALETEAGQLLTMSMVGTKDGNRATAIELDEVALPQIEIPQRLRLKPAEKTAILNEVNYQILLWAYAQTASHLPEGQRGQFEDFAQAQQRILWALGGMAGEGLIKIKGGFIND